MIEGNLHGLCQRLIRTHDTMLHAQVGDDEPDIHIVEAVALGQALRVIANAGDKVTLSLHEHPRVVGGHEKAVGVGNGVAGKTARAEHHHLRLFVGAAQNLDQIDSSHNNIDKS